MEVLEIEEETFAGIDDDDAGSESSAVFDVFDNTESAAALDSSINENETFNFWLQ